MARGSPTGAASIVSSWLPGILAIVLVIAPEGISATCRQENRPAIEWDKRRVAAVKSEKRGLPNGEGRFVSCDGLSLWYKVSGHGRALLVPTPGWGASS